MATKANNSARVHSATIAFRADYSLSKRVKVEVVSDNGQVIQLSATVGGRDGSRVWDWYQVVDGVAARTSLR